MAEAGAEQTQQNPTPEGAGTDSGVPEQKRLYADKFQTDSELEKGYLEAEKRYHESRQEIRDMREQLARAQEAYTQQSRQSYGMANNDPDVNTQVLQTFYQNPVQVLQQVKEVAKREALESWERQQSARAQEAERVKDWASRNQDVGQFRELMGFYVNQLGARNPHMDTIDKLDEAARLTRARALELQKAPIRTPTSEDHREAPSASGPRRQAATQPSQGDPNDPEVRMKNYLAERQRLRQPQPRR